jgi:2-polyprenyl-3-methyl-5-hydroxy-6-metoxy-1,4-benzoquinol methylase
MPCSRPLTRQPGGAMVVTTLNRTAKAFAQAVLLAEWVLHWAPAGEAEIRHSILGIEFISSIIVVFNMILCQQLLTPAVFGGFVTGVSPL